MGKKLVSRTAKVLSETKKRGGKEAIAIAYEHIPRDPEEQKHGSLYAVIELEDTGGHAEEIAERIIDLLHDAYYDNTEKSSLDSFETALAKINEELADRSSEGQINWLGKLNAVLGVLSGNTLHLTQAGRAEAYLYRGDHTLHVTDDLSGDGINPARTFINVASGDLTEKDKIVFVTPGVFYKLSKNELKKYVCENSPKVASENISRLLGSENGTNIPNALLLMEMVSPEAFAVEPEPEAATETWVKDERNVMEPVAEQTMQGTAKAFEMLGKAASGASTFIATKAMPMIKSKGANLSKGFKKEDSAERVILESEERISTDLEISEGVLETPREEINREIRISERESRPTLLSSLERFNFRSRTKGIGQSLKRLPLPRGKSSFIYLIAVVFLLASVGGYIFYNQTVGKTKVAGENTMAQAKTNYESAVAAISSGDRVAAIEDLKAAEKLANEAKADASLKDQATALLADIEKLKDQASGIVRNSAKEFATLGTETEALFTDGNLIYALDFDKGALFSVDSKSGVKASLIADADLGAKISFATYIKSRKVIYVYTEEKNAYEINPKTKRATKQNVSGGWEDAIAADSYLTSVYLLSPNSNSLYKHVKTGTGYGQKTKYFKSTVAIPEAVDVAIDSDVYILSANGEIQKFTAGTAQSYQIKGLPEQLSKGVDIFTSPEVEGLYVTDGARVTKIDADQNFVSHYTSDSVKKIQGLTVIDKTNTIYIQSEGKVYTITF